MLKFVKEFGRKSCEEQLFAETQAGDVIEVPGAVPMPSYIA